MTMAPARAQPRDGGGIVRRPVGEGRARRGGRQTGDVDVVLDGDRHAVERQAVRFAAGRRVRFGQRLGLVAQRDEDRRIVVGANAGVALRHGISR